MKKKNQLSVFQSNTLRKPGDSLSACVTKTNRQVLKRSINNGTVKDSVTRYPNGTIVTTHTQKNGK